VTAGSDTTAIFLRTIFYHLIKYPATYKRLLDELDQAANEGRLSEFVSWKESRELPYLDAVIKEAGRMHPPFGLHLERVVPPEGDTICGQPLPGGTVIGISGWAVHRNKETFGEDADIWKPERWLCDEAQRRKMERALLTVRQVPSLFFCLLVSFPDKMLTMTPSSSALATVSV
jgi:cytochrome P450